MLHAKESGVPPPILFPLAEIDLTATVWDRERIYSRLPHRHEFQVLDRICHLDLDAGRIVALVDVRSDAWWARGHVPGRPILPGVLMLEMVAQASAILLKAKHTDHDAFVGFAGVEDCKFREAIYPPASLLIVCEAIDFRPRRIVSKTQAIIEDRIAFEARVTGLAFRE